MFWNEISANLLNVFFVRTEKQNVELELLENLFVANGLMS